VLAESPMASKKTSFGYHYYFRYAQARPPQLNSIPAGEPLDEVIPRELVWDKTLFGLVLSVNEGDAFKNLTDPGFESIPNKYLLDNPLSYVHYQLEKCFYHGLRSLAQKQGSNIITGLEFYALNHGVGAYSPLDWHQEAFRKSLDKVVSESSTEPKTASSPR